MNIVSLVANMQKELDYYKELSREQAAIIKQLVDGPQEFEYIHPFDLSDLYNSDNSDKSGVIDIWITGEGNDKFITADGKKYKQSVHIPAKAKNKA